MTLAAWLEDKHTLVADGAWGTQLSARGLRTGVPEEWNLSHPDEVAAIAAAYAAAGANIVLTNTFGGSPIKLAKAGGLDCEAVNRLGVELSRQGAGEQALVFASIGPTGELVGLTSTLTEEDLERAFAAQVAAIAQGRPDGLVIETMTDLTEALCALRAAKSHTDLPVAVTMAFDEGSRGVATMMGVTPERAAAELTGAGADLVGANCGRLGDDAWVQTVSAMVANTDRPVWAKANAGIPQLVGGQPVFGMTPGAFAELGVRLAEAGARVVGGCCGTTPEHIAALADALAEGG